MRGFSISHALSGTSVLLGARIVGACVGLLTQALLAWILSSHGLGLFYLATSVATVVGTVAAFGYPGVAVRFIARYRARGQPQMLHGFVARAQRDTAWTSGVAAAIVIATVLLSGAGSEETRVALIVAGIAIPAIAFLRVNGSIAAAVGAFNQSFLPDLFYRPLLLLVMLALFVGLAGPPSALFAIALATLACIAVASVQAFRLPGCLPAGAASQSLDRRLTRHWRVVGGPLLILSIVSSLFADLTLVILGTVLPKAQLAVFGVSLKLAFLVGFAIQLLHEFAAPEISVRYFRSERDAIRKTIASLNLALIVFTLTALAVATLLGRHILAVFGPEFVIGYHALLILVSAQIVRAAAGPSMTLLIAAGLQSLVSAIATAAVAMLAATIVILVPRFGLQGAAAAVALTIAFWTVTGALSVRWKIGIRTDLIDSIRFLVTRAAGSIPMLLSRVGR